MPRPTSDKAGSKFKLMVNVDWLNVKNGFLLFKQESIKLLDRFRLDTTWRRSTDNDLEDNIVNIE